MLCSIEIDLTEENKPIVNNIMKLIRLTVDPTAKIYKVSEDDSEEVKVMPPAREMEQKMEEKKMTPAEKALLLKKCAAIITSRTDIIDISQQFNLLVAENVNEKAIQELFDLSNEDLQSIVLGQPYPYVVNKWKEKFSARHAAAIRQKEMTKNPPKTAAQVYHEAVNKDKISGFEGIDSLEMFFQKCKELSYSIFKVANIIKLSSARIQKHIDGIELLSPSNIRKINEKFNTAIPVTIIEKEEKIEKEKKITVDVSLFHGVQNIEDLRNICRDNKYGPGPMSKVTRMTWNTWQKIIDGELTQFRRNTLKTINKTLGCRLKFYSIADTNKTVSGSVTIENFKEKLNHIATTPDLKKYLRNNGITWGDLKAFFNFSSYSYLYLTNKEINTLNTYFGTNIEIKKSSYINPKTSEEVINFIRSYAAKNQKNGISVEQFIKELRSAGLTYSSMALAFKVEKQAVYNWILRNSVPDDRKVFIRKISDGIKFSN